MATKMAETSLRPKTFVVNISIETQASEIWEPFIYLLIYLFIYYINRTIGTQTIVTTKR